MSLLQPKRKRKRIYLIDVNNVVLSWPPGGLIGRKWYLPWQSKKLPDYKEALGWLEAYCADQVDDDHVYMLVQDDPRGEDWRLEENTELHLVNTADADAAIVLLACHLDGQSIDDWREAALCAIAPSSPSIFPKEPFGEYVPRMARLASALNEVHDDIIGQWTEVLPSNWEVVVITRDVNLREACRLAGAVVDGEPVSEWYEAMAGAWRQRKQVPSDQRMPSRGKEEAKTMANGTVHADRRNHKEPVDVRIDGAYLQFDEITSRGGVALKLSMPNGAGYIRVFDNRSNKLEFYRQFVAENASISGARAELKDLLATQRTLSELSLEVPAEIGQSIESIEAKIAASSDLASIVTGKAVFVCRVLEPEKGSASAIEFFLNDVPDNQQDDPAPPLWVLVVSAPGSRRATLYTRGQWFLPGSCFRVVNEAIFVIIGDKVLYCTESVDGGRAYTTGMAAVGTGGEIVQVETPIGGEGGLEIFRVSPAAETSMGRAIRNAKPPKDGNGDEDDVKASDPTRVPSDVPGTDTKEDEADDRQLESPNDLARDLDLSPDLPKSQMHGDNPSPTPLELEGYGSSPRLGTAIKTMER